MIHKACCQLFACFGKLSKKNKDRMVPGLQIIDQSEMLLTEVLLFLIVNYTRSTSFFPVFGQRK